MKGILIAFEGIDGAGKSTQIRMLASYLEAQGYTVCVTAEPTRGQYGQQIRAAANSHHRLSPDDERQLFVLDRREHLETCILPALERGEIVITDRYLYSSVAYQGARYDETGADAVALQHDIYVQNREFAPEADILVYMKLDVDTAISRISAGRQTLDAFETRNNLVKVADAFERLVPRIKGAIVIDAAQPEQVIADALRHKIRAYLENL